VLSHISFGSRVFRFFERVIRIVFFGDCLPHILLLRRLLLLDRLGSCLMLRLHSDVDR
jgi:hypothetical protein